ncbi:bifunctional hydroxymethylpyrimidine kinase/phosphomethylpyrimidine kinase [Labilibaculum antarcticum]|uniref:hydroxymethylpyrimidine kinase n=1 Tax=Labilibaculum antarcticum TaxID=1717717 RepID=A0A1Y1CNP4_9BACT|nr:hydroxymethylpyrimidine/phosphomethylpyrimidine kinase [Labilibaculum antarcticum]BAX82059.1 hydroxymethylpyrimidine/phosphomethylpyrimidine kinase [Labilibaculum antarcticum]
MEYFLTIAASDSSGGAGIQQDCKVAHDLGYWALSALTGITVQNFEKVFSVESVNPELLQSQIEKLLQSFPVRTVKIGAICSQENLMVICNCLQQFPKIHVVLDPVLASTSGKALFDSSALHLLKEELFPLCELITPNKQEFELLADCKINTVEEGIEIAKEKSKEWGTAILLKGGHFTDDKIREALICKSEVYHFEKERKNFKYQHGTGCTLSTAVSCFLGENESAINSCRLASDYLDEHYFSLQNQF